MAEHLLQRLTLPTPHTAEPLLYARTTGNAVVAVDRVTLASGATLSFDTSFGVFAAGRWRRITQVNDLSVRVDAFGSGLVEIVAVEDSRERVVATQVLGSQPVTLVAPSLVGSTIGTMFVRIVASGEATVHGGEWFTTDAPAHDIRMSLSITTFNRQEYVRRTVENVLYLVNKIDSLRGSVRVLVVDNARNISFDTGPNAPISVIENLNLGGAGGFARGLMQLRLDGWATHVLFMDDDITLEPEALVRTMALFRYAKDDRLCVHGAMLSEERQWMQFEAGAEYSWRSIYPLQALGRDDDLREREIALQDAPEIPFAYTAWWYTAFPIDITPDNPLPVFVRGDDVAFGLMHTGKHSVTLNGIIVWHADFGLKNNPSSLFYEARNLALIDTLVFDKHRWWNLAYRFSSFGFRNLFSMRYASTEYMLKGLHAYMAGPAEWMKIDHSALHDQLRACTEERPAPLSPELAALTVRQPRHKAIRAVGFVVAVGLVGGYIVPKRLRRRGIGTAPIDARAVGVATLRDQILYRHERIADGYLVQRDTKRFFSLLGEVIGAIFQIRRSYKRLRREYRAAYSQLISDEAWESRFAGNPIELR